MKLYEINKGSKIVVEVSDGSSYITFDHIDGMYSYCVTEKGEVVHLGASTELENYSGPDARFKGMYQIKSHA